MNLFISAGNAAAECQIHMGPDFFSLSFFFLIDNPWIQEEISSGHVYMDPEIKYSQS